MRTTVARVWHRFGGWVAGFARKSGALVAGAVLVAGCGGSSHAAGSGAGTSIAAALIAFVAPRDGADTVIGGQLANFEQTVQTKLLDDCMTSDGFSAPLFPGGGPPSDLGNPQFPNLPVIEATHDLGLFSGGPSSFVDPQAGMSRPERMAWEARINHCFGVTQGRSPLFGSARFGQLSSGWFNVVNQVSGSARIRKLSKTAAVCSAAHGVPATSVMSLYAQLQRLLGPISSSGATSTKVLALQAKGAHVLATCWAKVIDETTALLSARRATYLAKNASAIAALETQVDQQVRSLGRQYGLKLVLAPS